MVNIILECVLKLKTLLLPYLQDIKQKLYHTIYYASTSLTL